MLGWFKKKFGRKKKVEEETPVEVPQESELEQSESPEQQPPAEPVTQAQEPPEEVVEPPPAAPEPEPVEDKPVKEEPVETVPEPPVSEQTTEEASGVAEADEPALEVEPEPAPAEEAVPEAPPMEELLAEEAREGEPPAVGSSLAEAAEEPPVEAEEEEREQEAATPAAATDAETGIEPQPVEAEIALPGDDQPEVVDEEQVVASSEPEPAAAVEPAPQEPEADIQESDHIVAQPETVLDQAPTGEEPVAAEAEPQVEETVAEVVEEVIEEAEAALEAGEPPVLEQTDELTALEEEDEQSRSLFRRLQQRLGKTRDSFVERIDTLFLGKKEIDQDLFDELEEILITADLGVETSTDILEYARKTVKRDKLSDPRSLKAVFRERILSYIAAADQPAEKVMPEKGPFVIMVVGVNGVGKTTTIGKVANKFVNSGQSVLLVAADTFRAAAIDQLKIWGERVGVEVVAQAPGADPSSVVFDGMEYGMAHGYDVIIIDTAGRLHTSVNLMEELKKIKRVIGKKMPRAPHEVMLVLDATTGQNGLSQAKLFDAAVDVTGLALTKLDGTAKGGIVANICREMRIPVRFIGIGEQMEDLRDFDSREFVDALFADRDER